MQTTRGQVREMRRQARSRLVKIPFIYNIEPIKDGSHLMP